MSCTRQRIVDRARAWLGCRESDGSHKAIIDVYNSHRPKARGYTLKYTDPWCAGFVSACAIAAGATDIIPTEVGCGKFIALLQKMGIWVEQDGYIPLPGDLLFYDWADDGAGENRDGASHVGIVEQVEGDRLTVIEGNYQNAVKRRSMQVDGRYIRGYGVPKYREGACMTLPALKKGTERAGVKPVKALLRSLGYPLGDESSGHSFGPKTHAALTAFQKDRGLPPTGQTDEATWRALLEVAE